MHPLDEAEIKLKEAARNWRFVETRDSSTSEGGLEARADGWMALKEAARAYGDVWSRFVIPADTK